jgi:hypothetical protein
MAAGIAATQESDGSEERHSASPFLKDSKEDITLGWKKSVELAHVSFNEGWKQCIPTLLVAIRPDFDLAERVPSAPELLIVYDSSRRISRSFSDRLASFKLEMQMSFEEGK